MLTNQNEIPFLQEKYTRLLEKQQFNEKNLDYSILEQHLPVLQKLAETSNSLVTVFDLFQKRHVFHSTHSESFMGYSKTEFEEGGEYFLDSKTHPEDYATLLKNGITLFKVLTVLPLEMKLNCKLINEFRIRNPYGQYTRVIEQQQALELDNQGNVWLAMSILDISPNQNIHDKLKAQIINFKTGEFVPLLESKGDTDISLTKREIEILKHIREGKLSKEISDQLFISVHTVNTHRQKVLEKLNAGNSIEAIIIASRLGLI